MSKTKNYFWDLAEQESDIIINKYVKDEITNEHNVEEVLYYAKEEAA